MGCDRLFIVLSGLKIPVSGVQFSPCPPTPLNANAHFAVAAPQGARRAGSRLGLNLGVLCGSAPRVSWTRRERPSTMTPPTWTTYLSGWPGPKSRRVTDVVSTAQAARTAAADSPPGLAPRSARAATSPRAPAPAHTRSCSHTRRECGACAQAATRAGAGGRHACA
jgi:hypothetical protein